MRLTTERKLCGGVLLLAVIALGVDRLFLGEAGGPAAAGAAETVPATEQAAPSPARALAAAAGMGVPVAKQLAALPAHQVPLDGFSLSVRWHEVIEHAEAAAAALQPAGRAEVEPAIDPAIASFRKHQLTAVLSEQGQPVKALVKVAPAEGRRMSSRLLKVGDELDGFKLILLDRASATFEDPSGKVPVELELPVAGDRQ